ncbi:MAG: M1 family metallopeptidase [Myxococcota bacterium]
MRAFLVAAALLLVPLPVLAAEERLSTTVRPQRYALSLEVDPAREDYQGTQVIPLTLSNATSEIRLHSVGLTVLDVAVKSGKRAAGRARFQQQREILSVRPAKELPAGEAELTIRFKGKLDPRLRGIYRVKQGEDFYVATQFEAVDARRMAPCFDEPAFKVPFQLTVTVPERHMAISNGAVVGEKPVGKGLKRVEFRETLPLPTYLWALLIGPFEAVDAGKVGSTPIRIVVPRGRTALAGYAAESTVGALRILEEYFGIPYAYGKLDMIALPEFASGAMENAGAVTFREEALLIDKATAPTAARRRVAGIVAHELAHQWFGDLVTMAWWDDLWLNEAFATWMARKVVDVFDPRLEASQEALGGRARAFWMDALPSTHAIQTPVESAERAEEIFDTITYNKGASVLGMLEAWLGRDAFRSGLRHYLTTHAHQNATANDLYTSLSQASGREVHPVAHAWFPQAGHPVLDVQLDCKTTPTLTLTQKRFMLLGSAPSTTWQVPVCARYPTESGALRTTCGLARDGTATLPLETRQCPAWVLPNAGEVGFYRYTLPANLWGALVAAAPAQLSVEERVGLVDNGWALVRHGSLGVDAYLKLFETLRGERNRHVLSAMASRYDVMREALVDEADLSAFRALVAAQFGPMASELGWDVRPGDDEGTRELRVTLLSAMARLAEDPAHVAAAQQRARAWLKDVNAVPADVARVAMTVQASRLTREELHAMMKEASVATLPERRVLLLSSMSPARDPQVMEEALAVALDERVRVQDMGYVMWPAFEEVETRDRAWEWLRRNHGPLSRRMSAAHAAYLPMAGAGFCSAARRDELRAFFSDPAHRVESMGPRLAEALDSVEACTQLRAQQQQRMKTYLATLPPGTRPTAPARR